MRISGIILLACLLAACSKSNNNVTGPSNSDTTNVSFSSQIQPIFTANCTFSGCHVSSGTLAPMSLESGKAYNNIVDAASTEEPQFKRVSPYMPDSSYLYLKITNSPGISGVQMPKGMAPLPSSDIATIKAWIDQGAKNN